MTQTLTAVDSTNWTAVVSPINCKTVVFSNGEAGGGDVNRRIVDTDANTQRLIPYGTDYIWKKSDEPQNAMSSRAFFTAGSTVAYLKSVSGSFNVATEFIE